MGDTLFKIAGNLSIAEDPEIWKQDIALLYGSALEIPQRNRISLGEMFVTARFWQLEGEAFRGERSADVPIHVKSGTAKEVLADQVVVTIDSGDQFS